MSRIMKTRALLILLATVIALGSYLFVRLPRPGLGNAVRSHTPKYIFILFADGAGITHMEITRMYNRVVHKEGLNIPDKIIKEGSLGLLTTHSANSLTTDSAAAATAMGNGCKAKTGALGVCEDGTIPKTVLEVAKEKGMRIGLITNATIYDASPAGFAGHVPDRGDFSLIIDQYLRLAPDLLLGGGRDQFLPQGRPGSGRKDDRDMIAAFLKQGYVYVSDRNELFRARGAKILGLFNLHDMNFEIDRDKDREPSVSEMTQAAIRHLEEGNQRGFVVFIEDEHVDSAGHLTDVASSIREYREFDRAVGVVYEFYRSHPRETLILVTSDHETGGLGFTRALEELSAGPNSKRLSGTEEDLKKIHSIPISIKKATEILGTKPTSESIDRLMRDYFKGFTLAPDIKKMILTKQVAARNIYADPIATGLGMMVANNTQAYWGSSTHTNQPVFVAALGVGSERFRGYQDNTDFAKPLLALLREKDSA